jgi:hypothetical protein
VILQRLAWISQIALVIAAVLGYLYTVKPIRQKQLLDEQIAERTISLKAATETLEALKAEAGLLRSENVKLGTEAKDVYEQLRHKLALEIISMPSHCGPKREGVPHAPSEVPACMTKVAKDRIAGSLHQDDRDNLLQIISRHSAQMVAAGNEVNKKFAAKKRQIDPELVTVKAELENSDSEVRAEIFKLRTARAGGKIVEPDPPSGPIMIRTHEDQIAYDNYLARRRKLVDRLNILNRDKVLFDVDLDSAHDDALSKIASQIYDEFSASTHKR